MFRAVLIAALVVFAPVVMAQEAPERATSIEVTSGPGGAIYRPTVGPASSATRTRVWPVSPLNGYPVPPGYKVAWDDGRLNPNRGPGRAPPGR
ncbi:MAG: hypothetical protein AAGF74_07495 [Pseudomonadota bacterium]